MNRLAELRKKRGVSLNEMASELTRRSFRITSMTISRYERGQREPNIHILIMIADYFNVSIDYLVGRSDVR